MFADRPNERRIGIGNYFKGRLEYDSSDIKSRLMRMHRCLKAAWYLQQEDQTIEYMISEDERIANGKPCPITNLYSQKPRLSRFTKIYQELFTVDYVTSPDRWYIETPFSVINWRQIELMSLLSRLADLTAQESLLELPFTPEIA